MKAAAVFALLIAIASGLWGCIDFGINVSNREKHMREANTRSSSFYYDLAKIDIDDSQERQDGFLLLFAFSALTASISLSAQAKYNLGPLKPVTPPWE